MIPGSLLLTLERDGLVTDQQVSHGGFMAVSTALAMIGQYDSLQPGDKLTVERNEGASIVPPMAPPAGPATGEASDMAEQFSTWMTAREAAALAGMLARHGGKQSLVVRVAQMEVQCRQASRLIRAMLRQVHSSDVFRLPPEE
jgi:hypothetical protein